MAESKEQERKSRKARARKRKGRAMKGTGGKLRASITVEAALVMPIVLMAMASLIAFGMKTHDLVLGNLVTNEITERYGHLPEERETDQLEAYGNERLTHTVSGMSYALGLEEYRDGSRASLQGPEGSRVLTDAGFRPEKIMRKMTLIEGILSE